MIEGDNKNQVFKDLCDKAQRMRTLEKEIAECENIIIGYKEHLAFSREVYPGAIILMMYELKKEYYDAQEKLAKLQEEYDDVSKVYDCLRIYYGTLVKSKPVCDHMGQCTLCVLWSADGCKLVRD